MMLITALPSRVSANRIGKKAGTIVVVMAVGALVSMAMGSLNFRRGHLGAIRGVVMPVTLIIGPIGAPAAGYVYDQLGS